MKISIVCITLLLALSNLAEAGSYKKKGDVLLLNDKNWKQATEEHETLFVKFYAPWCPHCK